VSTSDSSGDFLPDAIQTEYTADFMTDPGFELFGDWDMQSFINTDALGLELAVSDFEATGLI
jgi:hypothetical protein